MEEINQDAIKQRNKNHLREVKRTEVASERGGARETRSKVVCRQVIEVGKDSVAPQEIEGGKRKRLKAGVL